MRPADQAAVNRERASNGAALSEAINWTHQAMQEMTDAGAISKLGAALNTLTTIQEQLYAPPPARPGGP